MNRRQFIDQSNAVVAAVMLGAGTAAAATSTFQPI